MKKWPNWLSAGVLMIPENEMGGGTGTGTGTGTETPAAKTTITIGGKEYTPEQAQAAISLHNALSDEDTGKEIVTQLAQRLGLLNKDGDLKDGKNTPESREKLEGKIHKTLKSKLGKEYAAFADLVGPALDEAVNELLGEVRGTVEKTVTDQTWSDGVNKFLESHTLTDEIQDKMKELVEEAPPNVKNKNFDQQKYLGRVYKQAIEELGVEAPKAPRKSRADDEGDDEGRPKIVVRERPTMASNEDRLDRIVEDSMKGIRYRT